jgi:hypothetical protein
LEADPRNATAPITIPIASIPAPIANPKIIVFFFVPVSACLLADSNLAWQFSQTTTSFHTIAVSVLGIRLPHLRHLSAMSLIVSALPSPN